MENSPPGTSIDPVSLFWHFLLLGILFLGGCAAPLQEYVSPSSQATETVVLLHGLGRGSSAMRYLEYRLDQAGYEVFNIAYPSTELSPEALVTLLRNRVQLCCAQRQRVNFVAHSMGGVLLRAMLAERPRVQVGRVVVLGSPARGTALVDWLEDNYLFRVLAGPAALRMGTGENSFSRQLPTPDYELGVIAGTRSMNPIGSWILEGPDDGIVAVESTRIEGMKDFMLADSDHVLMRYSDEVADAVIRFLRLGYFGNHHGIGDELE